MKMLDEKLINEVFGGGGNGNTGCGEVNHQIGRGRHPVEPTTPTECNNGRGGRGRGGPR